MKKKKNNTGLIVCVGIAGLVAALLYFKDKKEKSTCKPEAVPVDIDGDGEADGYGMDTTGDGKIDTIFVDTTGDGYSDTLIADTTGDGQFDTAFVDLDGDGKDDIAIDLTQLNT